MRGRPGRRTREKRGSALHTIALCNDFCFPYLHFLSFLRPPPFLLRESAYTTRAISEHASACRFARTRRAALFLALERKAPTVSLAEEGSGARPFASFASPSVASVTALRGVLAGGRPAFPTSSLPLQWPRATQSSPAQRAHTIPSRVPGGSPTRPPRRFRNTIRPVLMACAALPIRVGPD